MKSLEADVKPKVQLTVKALDEGTVLVGDRRVKLIESNRQSFSWKSIVHAVAPEDAINAVKDDFAVLSTSYSAKVVG